MALNLLVRLLPQEPYNGMVPNKVTPQISRTAQTTETAMTMTVYEKVLLASDTHTSVLNSVTGDLFSWTPLIDPLLSLQNTS